MQTAVRMDHFRYGRIAFWALRGDLTGRRARLLAERVDLFFRAGETSLLLDLRGADPVDSAGAAALRRCRAHPGFRVVGRPAAWIDLPLAVREGLDELDPAPDLETGLAAAAAALKSPPPLELRAHVRIPVQLPVELLRGDRAALVTLRDLSRGGAGLDLVPEEWISELAGSPPDLALGGLAADPLGRELLGGFAPEPVPVGVARRGAGGLLGVRFFPEGRPPV